MVITNNSHATSKVMSGGERIAIELTRQWVETGQARVTIVGSNLTRALWRRHIDDSLITFHQISTLDEDRSLLWSYPKRVAQGMVYALRYRMDPGKYNVVYSSSDFWPDTLTGLVLYLRNRKKCRWIAGFYLFAPNPFKGFREQGSWGVPRPRETAFFLSQRPIYHLVRRLADVVFVTSEPDVNRFVTARRPRDRVVVIRGGVDVSEADSYLRGAEGAKEYDAVFVGRFHPQKGVVELMDIWRRVVDEIPGARLAIIGAGPLEGELRRRVAARGLEGEVSLLGYLDGEPKYEVFRKSRIILHPALYDSGGMAAAEGMAWGLPGVAYDLLALKSYYPRGMSKVPVGDSKGFASAIVALLTDDELRSRLSKEARELIRSEWTWAGQSDRIWSSLESSGIVPVRRERG